MIKNQILAVAALLALFPACTFAGASNSDPLPSADALIQKNVAARGGAAKWRQVSTLEIQGNMDAGKGVQLPYTMELKRGRKVRVEIAFQGKKAVQMYDGKQGWKVRPFLGHTDAEPFTADEEKKASLDSDIDGPLVDYAAKGTRAEVEGKDLVEGHPAYRLKLTMKDGQVRHVWLDDETYLECKLDGTRRLDGKEKKVETLLRDYRMVDGIKLPYLYETAVDGVKQTGTIVVSSVRVNPALDDTLFARAKQPD